MPVKSLSSLLMIAVLLGACATIPPRIIPAPTQGPDAAAPGAYPTPGDQPVSKGLPYPAQPTLPGVVSAYPPQEPGSAEPGSAEPGQPPLDAPKPRPGVVQPSDFDTAYAPQPGDDKLMRGKVYLEHMDILALESFPPQFNLSLSGNLPTPCHKLRIKVNPPDTDHKIQVEVYSVFDPAEICIQLLEPLLVSVPLQGFASGKYQVLVNSHPVGEIDVP